MIPRDKEKDKEKEKEKDKENESRDLIHVFVWSTLQEERFWFQRLQSIVENTSTSALWNRKHGLVENNVTTYIIRCLEEVNQKLVDASAMESTSIATFPNIIETKKRVLVDVVERLWAVVYKYGTHYLDDFTFLLSLCVYKKVRVEFPTACSIDKLRILNKFFHLFHCKVFTKAQLQKELGANQSFDPAQINYKCLVPEAKHNYYFRIHGMRLLLAYKDKIYMLYGLFDDILPSTLPCQSPEHFLYQCRQQIAQQGLIEGLEKQFIDDIMPFFSLSDLFLFPVHVSNCRTVGQIPTHGWLHEWFSKIATLENLVLKSKIESIVHKFNDLSIYEKVQFFRYLLQSKNTEVHYITCLLYDLFSMSKTPSVTTATTATTDFNNIIYDSLPWKQKQMLKNSVQNSIQTLQNFMVAYDSNRITLEQQVFMMRVPERVKEKALVKLKEVKSKAEELNGKARQYLDGLLRIPFGQLREEPILVQGKQIKDTFKKLFPDVYLTSTDMSSLAAFLQTWLQEQVQERQTAAFWNTYTMDTLVPYAATHNIKRAKKAELVKAIIELFVQTDFQSTHAPLWSIVDDIAYNSAVNLLYEIYKVKTGLQNVEQTLDHSVYGHSSAKKKIVQVIGQWLSSTDNKQGGYCFGFEGEPGIGKTSLANQGLSQCLKDENGQPRPFHIIALGGCCNSSTLEGHNYTYSNSTWGRIADILMESKCMNPIIYIDELDKVSKTENGKEIIGILIHIIDSSQNASFQDKYFSGIDIDLSQVLFVFSYNNPEDIDKILLDRIHRIPFDSLSVADKVVIVKQYILPSLEKKMGFTTDTVTIEDEVIEHIVDTYTNESGIRKTKQLLFDIYSQINLDLLHCAVHTLPLILTKDLVDKKYLYKAPKNTLERIHATPEIGMMNALYATQNGNGGIIKIECMMIPANSLLEMKLTGSLGKVFTESMEICKNLAWALISTDAKTAWLHKFDKTKIQGLHVHFGDCNTPKEGASASLASALTIYSVLTQRPLRNDIAMTGETNLFGDAKRIGGVDAKFLGGIKAGVKTFFYPEENQSDVDRFFDKVGNKYKDSHQFFAIKNLAQVIHHPCNIFK